MLWVYCWIVALSTQVQDPGGPTDRMRPAGWEGNPWGPAATAARREGRLPAIPMTPSMAEWEAWGDANLKDGDVVFRLDDARTLLGYFPFSRFIANATGSPFSHTGVVAIEEGRRFVYDCSAAGVRRQPFVVWVLDNVGPFGAKRMRADIQKHADGVVAYCRRVFEEQPLFDFEFDLSDQKLYCAEMTEKAFRSQGLALSEPIPIGDWENLNRYPIVTGLFLASSTVTLERPISLANPVYVPGNEHNGIWASSLLETIYRPVGELDAGSDGPQTTGVNLRKDMAILRFVQAQIRRSLADAASRLVRGDRVGFLLERSRLWW